MGWAVKSFGKWRFKWRERGKVLTRTMPSSIRTKPEARRFARELTAKMKDFRERSSLKPWTLAMLKETILRQNDYSDRNKANVERYWQEIFNRFGKDRPAASLTKTDLLEWITAMKAEKVKRGSRTIQRKYSTLRHYFLTLSKALDEAVEQEVIQRNPCKLVNLTRELPDDCAKRERRLSEDEFRRLLDYTVSPWTNLYLRIAWATGGRMREITGLRWQDVDLESQTIAFRPHADRSIKSKVERVIHIPESLIESLNAAKRQRKGPWVIADRTGARVEDVKRSIQGTAKRAGIEGVTSHVIRHSVGSHLAGSGTPLPTVRDHLGHKDLRTTSIYTHSSESEKKEAAARLGKALESCGIAYKNAYNEGEIWEKLEACEEFRSLRDSIFQVVERETGLEPATLSLEGWGRAMGLLRNQGETSGKKGEAVGYRAIPIVPKRNQETATWYKSAYREAA